MGKLRTYSDMKPAVMTTVTQAGSSEQVWANRGFSTVVYLTHNKTDGDFKNPNLFSFRKATNVPGYYLRLEEGNLTGQWTYSRTTGVTYLSQTEPDISGVDHTTSDDLALARIYEKIRGGSNLIVDLAESAATIKMLRNAVSFRRLWSEFYQEVVRSRGYKNIKASRTSPMSLYSRRLDYLSGKWLEYRYGWTPLVLSTFDALDTALRVPNDQYVRVGSRKLHRTEVQTGSGTGSYANPRLVVSTITTNRTQYSLWFKPNGPGTQLYDWTSLNPLGIAWELVPLSFVFDWFVNVGDCLTAWENYLTFKSQFVKGYVTRTYERVATRDWSGSSTTILGSYYQHRMSEEHNQQRSVWLRREPLSSLPVPSGFRIKVDLNAKRFADAAALTKLLFLRNVRP